MRKTVTDSMQGEAFGVQRDGMGHDPLRQGLSCAEDVACHPPWWRRYWPLMNGANVRMMEQALARDYVPVGRVKEGKRQTTIWALRGGPGSKNLPLSPQGHAVSLYDNHAS